MAPAKDVTVWVKVVSGAWVGLSIKAAGLAGRKAWVAAQKGEVLVADPKEVPGAALEPACAKAGRKGVRVVGHPVGVVPAEAVEGKGRAAAVGAGLRAAGAGSK